MSSRGSMDTVDYVVTGLVLMVPVGIGVLYAIKDQHKTTRVEYLLGGRSMSKLPVAASLFVSYVSAVSVMGVPTEVFYFGSNFLMTYIGDMLALAVGSFTVVPLLYPLKLTSIFSYLQLRYNSKAVQLISSGIAMMGTICYMSIALLSPALALEACVGLPLWISIAVFGAVGSLYTALGGFKCVIWTDVFQTGIIFIGVIAIIVKAVTTVSGLGGVWQLSSNGGRLNFNEFSLDPRVRHTNWGLVIGHFCLWLSVVFNQPIMQRVSSMKSLRDAKLLLLYSLPLFAVFALLMIATGLGIFAYYTHHGCDPFQDGLISNRNQLAPFFVINALRDVPGMGGLFTAILCCGALSTLSSGINSAAAMTVEDFLKTILLSLSESTITMITKLLSVVFGLLIIGFTYIIKSLKGTVVQLAISVFGAFGSPILGIFLMGSMVPWANKVGALSGVAVSIAFNLWISIGSILHAGPPKPLPSLSTGSCSLWNVTSAVNPSHTAFSDVKIQSNWSSIHSDVNISSTMATPHPPRDKFFLYDISYTWYSPMGVALCMTVGLIVSYVTANMKHTVDDVDLAYCPPRYILPILRRYWGMANHPTDQYATVTQNTMLEKVLDNNAH